MSEYVPYHRDSIAEARRITANCKTPLGKYRVITKWVSRNVVYDYIKAKEIPKRGNILPDVDGCWKTRMGICQDIAALTVGMLRGVSIESVLAIGHADGMAHAWVESTINGKRYRFDRSGKAKVYKRERSY